MRINIGEVDVNSKQIYFYLAYIFLEYRLYKASLLLNLNDITTLFEVVKAMIWT